MVIGGAWLVSGTHQPTHAPAPHLAHVPTPPTPPPPFHVDCWLVVCCSRSSLVAMSRQMDHQQACYERSNTCTASWGSHGWKYPLTSVYVLRLLMKGVGWQLPPRSRTPSTGARNGSCGTGAGAGLDRGHDGSRARDGRRSRYSPRSCVQLPRAAGLGSPSAGGFGSRPWKSRRSRPSQQSQPQPSGPP